MNKNLPARDVAVLTTASVRLAHRNPLGFFSVFLFFNFYLYYYESQLSSSLLSLSSSLHCYRIVFVTPLCHCNNVHCYSHCDFLSVRIPYCTCFSQCTRMKTDQKTRSPPCGYLLSLYPSHSLLVHILALLTFKIVAFTLQNTSKTE